MIILQKALVLEAHENSMNIAKNQQTFFQIQKNKEELKTQ